LAANRAAYNQRMADNRSAYAAQHPGGGGGGGGGAGGGGGLRANRALQGKVPDAPAAGIIHDEKEGS
jgi:hypothetical protein